MGEPDRLAAFEARLAALKHKMESGLVDRARALRDMAERLEGGDGAARKEIKTESHKLRGVAGSYGHHDLTEAAGELEQRASISPPGVVGQMARELADLAENKGRHSKPPQPAAAAPTSPTASRASALPKLGSGRPKSTSISGRKVRVLAVDDDPVTQRLLLLTLQQVGGFDAMIVASATEALALLDQQSFDVILSDAMMPDMNGKEFRAAARARGARMPIVILSAASPDELGWSQEPESSGRWLRKPFKPSELVRDIVKIVDRQPR